MTVLEIRLDTIQGTPTDVKKLWADAEAVCAVLGLDSAAALRQAVEAIPEPKSWAGLKADGTPKGAKPAKGKAKPRAKVKRAHQAKPKARACRECGCTEDNACQTEVGGPCHWVEKDLCSACAPEVGDHLAEEEDEGAAEL